MLQAAIIIPHFNDALRLNRCLGALAPQLSDQVELVVVDNGSSDDLMVLRANFPSVRFIDEPQKGAAAARNRGVAETTAPMLFFLDADCVPAADWLKVALDHARTGDMIGGPVEIFHETAQPLSGAQAFEAVFAFNIRKYIQSKGFAVTANLLTHRCIFTEVGPFEPGLSEDVDWCHRARAKGYELHYEPRLVVHHPSRADWWALRQKWRRMTQERYALNPQTVHRRIIWIMLALAMPLSILAHTPRALTSTQLTRTRDRVAALGVLAHLRLLRSAWMIRQSLGLPIR